MVQLFVSLFRWMLINSSTGDTIFIRKSEPPEKISEIQFSPGKVRVRNFGSTTQNDNFHLFWSRLVPKFVCVLSLDGNHVALGCHDNDVYIYELRTEGRSVSLKARCKVKTWGFVCLLFVVLRDFLVLTYSPTVKITDPRDGSSQVFSASISICC